MKQNGTIKTITWMDNIRNTLCSLPKHSKAGQLLHLMEEVCTMQDARLVGYHVPFFR